MERDFADVIAQLQARADGAMQRERDAHSAQLQQLQVGCLRGHDIVVTAGVGRRHALVPWCMSSNAEAQQRSGREGEALSTALSASQSQQCQDPRSAHSNTTCGMVPGTAADAGARRRRR